MRGTDGDSRVGTQFGPYRRRRLIGRGGMGEVYEAEDTGKDRVVALKLLPEGVSHDQVFRKRLKREARSIKPAAMAFAPRSRGLPMK